MQGFYLTKSENEGEMRSGRDRICLVAWSSSSGLCGTDPGKGDNESARSLQSFERKIAGDRRNTRDGANKDIGPVKRVGSKECGGE